MTPSNAGDERLEWLIIGLLAKSSTDARWGAFAALSGTPQHPLPVTPKVAKALTREVGNAKAAIQAWSAQQVREARIDELRKAMFIASTSNGMRPGTVWEYARNKMAWEERLATLQAIANQGVLPDRNEGGGK
jgi:hypothetical protein